MLDVSNRLDMANIPELPRTPEELFQVAYSKSPPTRSYKSFLKYRSPTKQAFSGKAL